MWRKRTGTERNLLLFLRWVLIMRIAIAIVMVWVGYMPAAMAAYDGNDGSIHGTRFNRSAALIKDSVLNIGDDLKGIARYPVDHPRISLYSLLGIGGLVAVEKPVTRYYQDKFEPIFNDYNLRAPKFMSKTGIANARGASGLLMLGMAGSYVLGAAFDDSRSQLAALLSVKAAAYSVLVSQLVLKSLTGRMRPDPSLSTATGNRNSYTTNPYDFGHVHRPYLGAVRYGTAMPSFTFTLFFSVARVYQKVYHNYWLPYGLAAAALTSNIRGHHHWVSDMVAGSLVGTMIGTVVADNALGEDDKVSANLVVPVVSPQMTGLAWIHQF